MGFLTAGIAEFMHVALFITCLVDLYRPRVGFATLRLLEQAGCRVSVPTTQTCCGQPAYNNGDAAQTRRIAQQVIEAFAPYPYVIIPSGSCAGMLRVHYPQLFSDDPHWCSRAKELAGRCHELSSFLHDVLGHQPTATYAAKVVYHDACASLRELGVREQPRHLLEQVSGLELRTLHDSEQCCGFGGTFCVKYPDISARMVSDKVADIEASGADTVTATDLGCLLNIAGRLSRQGLPIRALHIAEILADMGEGPAIAESEPRSTPKSRDAGP